MELSALDAPSAARACDVGPCVVAHDLAESVALDDLVGHVSLGARHHDDRDADDVGNPSMPPDGSSPASSKMAGPGWVTSSRAAPCTKALLTPMLPACR